MTTKTKRGKKADKISKQKRESGLPCGGQGRKEVVEHTGVYRLSDPQAPAQGVIRTMPEFGQGQRGAAGYYDHGESGVFYIPPEKMEAIDNQVEIPLDEEVTLQGNLKVPAGASGIVLFVHGSGSSRFSPRNSVVAQVLNKAGLATLLFDLLTPAEEALDAKTAKLRFDLKLLTHRLIEVTEWVITNPLTHHLRVGYFGASTGAGAALVAAAQWPEVVGAIVSRGGRPDLAGWALLQVKAPTLLIVGGRDSVVFELNDGALHHLHVEKKLEIVPGATHLFEEPGALEQVAELARHWFCRFLTKS